MAPAASLYAWGITAPKGGAVWLPGALGGHWWSSDHAQGFCRQDPVPATGQFGIAGNTLHAINFAVCGADLVGSAGQAVYDPRPVVDRRDDVPEPPLRLRARQRGQEHGRLAPHLRLDDRDDGRRPDRRRPWPRR